MSRRNARRYGPGSPARAELMAQYERSVAAERARAAPQRAQRPARADRGDGRARTTSTPAWVWLMVAGALWWAFRPPDAAP
jgi:hypothetical protein